MAGPGASQLDRAFYTRIGMQKYGDPNLEFPPSAFRDLEWGSGHFLNRIVETGVQCEHDSGDDGRQVVVVRGSDVHSPAVRVGPATSAGVDATSAGVDATSPRRISIDFFFRGSDGCEIKVEVASVRGISHRRHTCIRLFSYALIYRVQRD